MCESIHQRPSTSPGTVLRRADTLPRTAPDYAMEAPAQSDRRTSDHVTEPLTSLKVLERYAGMASQEVGGEIVNTPEYAHAHDCSAASEGGQADGAQLRVPYAQSQQPSGIDGGSWAGAQRSHALNGATNYCKE